MCAQASAKGERERARESERERDLLGMILPKKADATIRCTHPHVLRPIAFWFLIVFTTYASAGLGRQAGSRRKSGEEKRGAEEEEEEDRRKINRLFMEEGISEPLLAAVDEEECAGGT